MSFGNGQHPDPDDYFSDTRMSFGDHLEELRTHLIRAIVGFCVALVFSFFVGRVVMRFIAAPVEAELQAYWDKYNKKKYREVLAAMREGRLGPGRRMESSLRMDIPALKKVLGMDAKSQERTRGLRSLVISTMLSIFLSLVVFVVASYWFFVPRMYAQQLLIMQLQQRVTELEARAAEPEPEAAEEAAAPPTEVWVSAPTQPADAGVAPAAK